MPIVSGKYQNPGWNDNASPAINATELNAMSGRLQDLDELALRAFTPKSITISTTWTGTGPWTQNIAVSGVLAAWDWRLGLHLSKITDDAARKLQEKAFGCITWVETYNGGITLTCRDKKPDVAISAVLAGEV